MNNNRLAQVLKKKGISKKDFAEMVGTSSQYIVGICNGKLSVSLKQLAKFAEALNVPLNDLIVAQRESDVFYCPHCGLPIRVVKNDEEE